MKTEIKHTAGPWGSTNELLEVCKIVNNSIFQDRDGEWRLSRPAETSHTLWQTSLVYCL